MSITAPDNSRGPILDLTLPASEDAVDIILRNKTTRKSLTLNLPAGWEGDDLSLDWRLRTIQDGSGADRSALLNSDRAALWAARPPFSGAVDVEIVVQGGPILGQDSFSQAVSGGSDPATGKTAEVGGVYAALPDSDATDFEIVEEGAKQVLRRESTEDEGGPFSGRSIGFTGINHDDLEFDIDFRWSGAEEFAGNVRIGHLVRVVDEDNYIFLLWSNLSDSQWQPVIAKVVGGSASFIGEGDDIEIPADEFSTLRSRAVGDTAELFIDVGRTGVFELAVTVSDSDFAGALAVGDAYIHDSHQGTGAVVRSYDNLLIADRTPVSYAASASLRWEKAYF